MDESIAADLLHELKEQLRFETLLTDISSRYVNLPVDRIDTFIEDDQRRICDCLGIDLSALWQWSDESAQSLTVTHLYSPPDGPSFPVGIDAQESFPWAFQKVLRGETFVLSTEAVIPEVARDRETLRNFGIKSSLVLPLSAGGGPLLGVLSFDTLHEERDWPDELVKRLKLVAQVFCNALVRKKSDRILRHSEERLSLAADSAGAGLWELNCNSNQIWATERAMAIFGYGDREMISMELFEQSVCPDDLAKVRQAIAESLESGEQLSVEYRILVNNDCMKWIHSSGRPFFKSDGKPDRLLGLSIDITERRNSELQRELTEERLVSAVDIAALGFYEMGKNLNIRYLDSRMREILGITPGAEADPRQFWLEHIHKDDLERVLGVTRKVLEEGVNRFTVEYRYMHPRHGILWLNHLSRALDRDGAGRATRVIGVMQDITEHKQKDIILSESLERYRAMVEAYDGLIYICSQDFRIEYMNPRMIERTGRDAVHELCYEALHNRNSICPWCINEEVFRGETVRWELQSPKDQSWYYVVDSPIQHADGSFSKLAMIMDITDRKLMEETLRENETILRDNQKDLKRLAGRMISVKEEELRRLSRELHDDLTQRLAVLAIEAGKLELRMNEEEQSFPGFKRKISRIKDQLIKVSEDVHRISRQLHPTILDDLGLVRAIESECSNLMQLEDIDIIFTIEDVQDRLPDDAPLCLYRIAQEGLHNIISHSGAKNCRVVLKGTDDTISLTVKDQGVGFDPDVVRNKPGLGLASMRERMHLVGGNLSIDSQPGRGTTIHATIPLKRTRT